MNATSKIRDLTALWPRLADLVEDLDKAPPALSVSIHQVNKWAEVGSIKADYYDAMIRAGQGRGLPVTADLLVALHARLPQRSRSDAVLHRDIVLEAVMAVSEAEAAEVLGLHCNTARRLGRLYQLHTPPPVGVERVKRGLLCVGAASRWCLVGLMAEMRRKLPRWYRSVRCKAGGRLSVTGISWSRTGATATLRRCLTNGAYPQRRSLRAGIC